MGRAILILFACSALMVAFAYQTQPQIVHTMLSLIDGSSSRTTGPATVQLSTPEKVSTKVSPRKSSAGPAAPALPATPPVEPAAAGKDSEKVQPRVFKVASESATLYSLNSAKGSVVAVLQKGEIVEPKLEINEGGEQWVFVQVVAQNISGFVQTQNLERK